MSARPCARISSVAPGSPAEAAGFSPGCAITHVDGEPVRDAIDWRWLSCEEAIELSYVDCDGESGTLVLEREPGEEWGFGFDGVVFDGVRSCRNACTFCFMRQLPKGMRATLAMRDDDFRLSFLEGTFVTLTNLDDADVGRICEQRLSPLRVSLHAVDAAVRRALIGRHADVGLANLERLLAAGIEVDAQVVLVPGANDGAVLDETLAWAYARPNIRTVGIVPLGYTRHQDVFDGSFDAPEDALAVIEQLAPLQERALAERGTPWVFAADEFYRNAFGERVLEEVPDAAFYGDFDMFEDGIGIIRSVADAFCEEACSQAAARAAQALEEAGAHARYLCGEAMEPYAGRLFEEAGASPRLSPLYAGNAFFGGNVNVTGLLCGCDLAAAIGRDAAHAPAPTLYAIPSVVFNACGRTLDDWTLDDIKGHVGPEIGERVLVAPPNPIDYMDEIANAAKALDR